MITVEQTYINDIRITLINKKECTDCYFNIGKDENEEPIEVHVYYPKKISKPDIYKKIALYCNKNA